MKNSKSIFLFCTFLLSLACVHAQAQNDEAQLFKNVFTYRPSTLKFEFKSYTAGYMNDIADPTRGGKASNGVSAGGHYSTYAITNPDYCTYTVWGIRGAIEIGSGEEEIDSHQLPKRGSSAQFRGVVPPGKKFQAEAAIYALPFRADGQAGLQIADFQIAGEDIHLLSFAMQAGDTIYAMRGGEVCLWPSQDHKSLLIHHADETFALYYFISLPLVKPGDKILPGQPIALSADNTLRTAFMHLNGDKMKGKEEPTGFPYSSFVPTLLTADGQQHPSEAGAYNLKAAPLTDDIITQDMNKADKKKYLKEKK